MENNAKGKITINQIIILLYFICHGSLLGAATSSMFVFSREDSWMVPIISCIIGMIPLLIYTSLMNRFENQHIFEIVDSLCGKILGKIINFILIIFVCSYLIISFWNLSNFISSQYLYNTPQGFIAILFIIPIIYLLSKNIHIILRSGIIIFILSFLFFIISVFALVPQVQIVNIFPILQNGIASPFESVFNTIGYLVLPLFLITCIPKNSIKNYQKFTKKIIIAYLLIQLSIILIVFCVLSIFGIELASLYQYPEFQILRRVTIGGFIERVESTLSIHWVLDLFMLITFCCYFIKTGMNHIIPIKNKLNQNIFHLIIALIMLVSLFIFPSNTSANNFLMHTYPIFCHIGFFIIPMILYLISIIQKKHS